MIGTPGDSCRNDHFSNRFTCPNCYTDHELYAGHGGKVIDCSCGARLSCKVELIQSSVCTIADPDEIDQDGPVEAAGS